MSTISYISIPFGMVLNISGTYSTAQYVLYKNINQSRIHSKGNSGFAVLTTVTLPGVLIVLYRNCSQVVECLGICLVR